MLPPAPTATGIEAAVVTASTSPARGSYRAVDAGGRRWRWTVTGAVAAGSATVTVTAANSAGSAEQSFAVTVLPPAPATVGSIEAATISEGGTHNVTASDYFAGEGVTYGAARSTVGGRRGSDGRQWR